MRHAQRPQTAEAISIIFFWKSGIVQVVMPSTLWPILRILLWVQLVQRALRLALILLIFKIGAWSGPLGFEASRLRLEIQAARFTIPTGRFGTQAYEEQSSPLHQAACMPWAWSCWMIRALDRVKGKRWRRSKTSSMVHGLRHDLSYCITILIRQPHNLSL